MKTVPHKNLALPCDHKQTMVLPLLWYTAATCHVPDSVVSEIEDIALDFVYGRLHKQGLVANHLPKTWLHRPCSQGGLGMPNIATSINLPGFRTMVNVLALQGASTTVLP
ncbi:hypothetical protein H310_09391 [Aphanomyces invadans]|uniref:Uncharacterized protein n=1 Tax=Aphanomyces invadans TaxID=157072 RepID=A0A024TVV9_9STRA|nr:hypothetical protein H310_09391 [Aphanomyces invadans]ETV97462.1 hypothetical protein H310_09391 [Aphanomyces invadans]|eukprot:XP_008873671.1 hypothetical protein H310_09391 [Aphanomyces invadans]